ncbi:MFS transporter [Paraburkholderia sp. IW21]|uniref:MFS transporter n=1 Tax=Paraburkholderia sp. IW21 TaxID=3242488 RepID=UPI003522494C
MNEKPALTRGMTFLFSCACGIIVANIYYSQPLLATIARTFDRAPADLGYLVTLTQLGYASGFVLIVPLGDVLDRRMLIVRLLLANVIALLAITLSPNYIVFAVANICLGITSCSTQLLIPLAASLADEQSRGRVVGVVMSGLLLGVLLARVAAGIVAQYTHWRLVYGIAAMTVLLLAIVLYTVLPRNPRTVRFNYVSLMGSLTQLLCSERVLMLRSLYGALAFACFSLVWTGLTFLLSQPPYSFNDGQIGMFGLVGVVGALAANSAGRLVDRGYGNRATGLFAAAILISFALIAGGTTSLVLLVSGIVLLDVGVQGLHISNQSVIYALTENARSRITTIYLASYFIGGAVGSSMASLAYATEGWRGLCLAGATLSGITLFLWIMSQGLTRSLFSER